jgi:hypothetical protein
MDHSVTRFIIDNMHMISRHDLHTLDLDTHLIANPEEALIFGCGI